MAGPRVLGGTEGSRTFRATFAVSVHEIKALHCFLLTGSNTRQSSIKFNWEKLSPVSNLKTEQRDKIHIFAKTECFILCFVRASWWSTTVHIAYTNKQSAY